MEKRSPESTKEFILINHHFMTAAEMAEELMLSHPRVLALCQELGVTAIKQSDRICEFILAHQDWTQEKIADHWKVSISSIILYVKKLGITVMTEKGLAIKTREETLKELKTKGITHFSRQLSEEAKEYLASITTINLPDRQPIKRPPAIYNQSGSQFTDELYNIITTKRVTPSAQDAFFK